MQSNQELFVQFIEKHASFVDSWGNWIIIAIFILTITVIYFTISRLKFILLKILIILFLLLPLFIMTFFTYLLNSPLKPFITSIATVQKALNKTVPEFEFINLRDHTTYTLSDFRGKVVVLNFWGTYCGPCVEEFLDLKKLEESENGKVVVVALSEESAEKISAFLANHVCPLIVGKFTGNGWIDLQTFKPLTLFIDKQGIAREYVFGRKDFNYFSEKSNAYLGY
jgi:thiol-disulfide isomerase/thioredoxin